MKQTTPWLLEVSKFLSPCLLYVSVKWNAFFSRVWKQIFGGGGDPLSRLFCIALQQVKEPGSSLSTQAIITVMMDEPFKMCEFCTVCCARNPRHHDFLTRPLLHSSSFTFIFLSPLFWFFSFFSFFLRLFLQIYIYIISFLLSVSLCFFVLYHVYILFSYESHMVRQSHLFYVFTLTLFDEEYKLQGF